MAKKKQNHKLAIGAIFGTLTGLVAGFLLAPKSGKETRQDIKRAVNNLVEDGQKVQQELARLIKLADQRLRRAGRRAGVKQKALVSQTKQVNRKLVAVLKSATQGKSNDKDLDRATKKARESLVNLKKYLKK